MVAAQALEDHSAENQLLDERRGDDGQNQAPLAIEQIDVFAHRLAGDSIEPRPVAEEIEVAQTDGDGCCGADGCVDDHGRFTVADRQTQILFESHRLRFPSGCQNERHAQHAAGDEAQGDPGAAGNDAQPLEHEKDIKNLQDEKEQRGGEAVGERDARSRACARIEQIGQALADFFPQAVNQKGDDDENHQAMPIARRDVNPSRADGGGKEHEGVELGDAAAARGVGIERISAKDPQRATDHRAENHRDQHVGRQRHKQPRKRQPQPAVSEKNGRIETGESTPEKNFLQQQSMQIARHTVEQPQRLPLGAQHRECRKHQHVSGHAECHGCDVLIVEKTAPQHGRIEGELHSQDHNGDDQRADEHVPVAPEKMQVFANDAGQRATQTPPYAPLRFAARTDSAAQDSSRFDHAAGHHRSQQNPFNREDNQSHHDDQAHSLHPDGRR